MDLDVHLSAIVARDSAAFGRFLAGAEGEVRESLRSFARVVDVEAVLQEALLRVWQVTPRFVPDGAPNGLLRLSVRIARNLAISEVRRTRTRPAAEDDLEARLAALPSNDAEPPDPLLRKVIAECHERLPEKPRQALDRRLERAGQPDDALAESLAMRLNTFLQNFGRARRMLAECLRKHGVVIDEELDT